MPPARDPSTWSLHVTRAHELTLWLLHVTLVQLNSIRGVESIEHLFIISPKAQLLLERQRSVVSVRDVSRDFFRSRWASPSINLACLLLDWPFYICEKLLKSWFINVYQGKVHIEVL